LRAGGRHAHDGRIVKRLDLATIADREELAPASAL
jgi:hypothetical protein